MSEVTANARTLPVRTSVSKVALAARIGYAAQGVVYLLVGFAAVGAAFGGKQAVGAEGAIQSLLDEPFGKFLLVLLAIGLLAYGFWRVYQGIKDPDHEGSDAKGIAARTGRVVSGLFHALLALYALSLAFDFGLGGAAGGAAGGAGGGGAGGGEGAKDATAWLMSQPFGRWLVGLLGLAFFAGAARQVQRGYTASFMRTLNVGSEGRKWVKPLGQAGFIARGVTFALIGIFLLIAAWQADPSEAEGLGGALRELHDQSWGPWLLGLIGLGLIAFAILRFVFARYWREDIVPTS